MNITDLDKDDVAEFTLAGFMTSSGKFELNRLIYDKLPEVIECNGKSYNLEKVKMKNLPATTSWIFNAVYS